MVDSKSSVVVIARQVDAGRRSDPKGIGRELEPALRALGRWGSRVPLSAAARAGADAAMVALETLFAPDGGEPLRVELRLPEVFGAVVDGDGLALARGPLPAASQLRR